MFVIRLRTVVLYAVILAIALISVNYWMRQQGQEVPVSASEVPQETGIPLPIIMYHGITEDSKKIGKYVISKEAFEEDLRAIQRMGYETVTVDEVIDYVYRGEALPAKPIMLTFDDGYYNNYCYAYPLLKQYNMKAVLSIIGKYTDLYTQTPDENAAYSHVTWDELNEMIDSGIFEIQNHSYDLHTNDKGRNGAKKKRGETSEQYAAFLKGDLAKLQMEMSEHTGYTPTTFTYPFGGVSKDSYPVIREMGFLASLSCEEKMNYIKSGDKEQLFMLNRYLRSHRKSLEQIVSAVEKNK